MAEQPRYPGSDADDGVASEPGSPTGKRNLGFVLVAVLGVGFVVLFIVLHLTGVAGPGGH